MKIIKKTILPLLIILTSFSNMSFIGKEPKKFKLFTEQVTQASPTIGSKAKKEKKRGIQLNLNKELLTLLYNEEPEQFQIDIPRPNGKVKTVILQKRNIVTSDFKVETSDGKTFKGKEVIGVHYKILDSKKKKTVGGFTVTSQEAMGMIPDGGKNVNISQNKKQKGTYMAFTDDEMAEQNPFVCESSDLAVKSIKNKQVEYDYSVQPQPEPTDNIMNYETAAAVGGSGCAVVPIYVECDYKMFLDNGSSVPATTTKVTSLFNLVKQLYDNEGIPIQISSIYVWTTTDPYASMTTANQILLNWATNRQGQFNGQLASFLTTRNNNLGGLAYVNTLCSSTANFNFNNIYNTFTNDATVYSWSVGCWAHELGHNFGSKHTHWCGWNLGNGRIGRIDSCYAGESSSGSTHCSSRTTPQEGTIMSYCHITTGGINFNLGFGPLPGAKLRETYNAATCVTGTRPPFITVQSPITYAIVGDTIQFDATTISATTYSWTGPSGFSSSTRNPTRNNVTTGMAGTYSVTGLKGTCTSNVAKRVVKIYNSISLPQTENFNTISSTVYPPTNWEIKNTNINNLYAGWMSPYYTFPTPTAKCLYYNLNGALSNVKDTVFAPPVKLDNISNLTLSFDVAHKLRNTSASFYDSLLVYIYTNKTNNLTLVYKKGGTNLSTSSSSTSTYQPSSATGSEWRTEIINLSNYDTSDRIRVAFVIKTKGTRNSNNLFIDNYSLSASAGSPLKTATISVDSLSNLDKAFTITGSIPDVHNATSYQVLEGSTVISSGSLSTNNSSNVTINRTNMSNGIYTYTLKLTDGTSTTTSNQIQVVVNYTPPRLITGTLSADSLNNKDKNYILNFSIPQNHNATSYQILTGSTIIKSGSLLNNNATVITTAFLNQNNATYVHTGRLLNTSLTPNSITSNSLNVTVNFVNTTIKQPTLSVDSVSNRDKTFILTISLPINHYTQSFDIVENGITISTTVLPNNNQYTATYTLSNKGNGTYVYTIVGKQGSNTSTSTPVNVTVNYVPIETCSSSSISVTNNRLPNFTYRFTLNKNCPTTGYRVLFYRGENTGSIIATNPNLTTEQLDLLNWQPVAGSERNNGSGTRNIVLTTTEIQTGVFERKAVPQPSVGNRWFKIEVVCTSCPYTIRNKIFYSFVLNQ